MEMLHYDFMQRAFFAGALIALIASVLGVYLLLRRQALMADMLSHVSLAGIAAGALLHWNPTATGFAVALAGSVAVEWVRRTYKTYSEISIAIIMIGGLSSAAILMSRSNALNKSFSSYLFGSVVAVNRTELILMAAAAAVGAVFFLLLRRPLYQVTFDEDTAKTAGLPVKWLSMGFSVLTGMIVLAAMPIVGVLLVSSLIVLPASLAIRMDRDDRRAWRRLYRLDGFLRLQHASGSQHRDDAAVDLAGRHWGAEGVRQARQADPSNP